MRTPIDVASLHASFGSRLLLAGFRRVLRRPVVGVCYHVVSDEHLRHIANIINYKSPAQFEQDLLYLLRFGKVVAYEDLVKAANDGCHLPSNAFHVSFDDGYAECFDVVRPLLLKHGVPCAFFVTPAFLDNTHIFVRNTVSLCIDRLNSLDDAAIGDLVGRAQQQFNAAVHDRIGMSRWTKGLYSDDSAVIEWLASQLDLEADRFLDDQRPYMTTDQVRQLAKEGFTIGGHTLDHPAMEELNNSEEFERQVVESCRIVCEIAGCASAPFAIPFEGSKETHETLGRIRAQNSCVGLIFDTHGFQPAGPGIINRVVADHTRHSQFNRTNLPMLLLRGYAAQVLRTLGLRK